MPEYDTQLAVLRKKLFFDPTGANVETFVQLVRQAVHFVVDAQGDGPVYPRRHGKPPLSAVIQSATLSSEILRDPSVLLQNLSREIEGAVKAGHPFMVKNIIPAPSLMHISVNAALSIYMLNGVTGEDAANALHAELKVAKVYATLAGYEAERAGGLFTFGGTATNLYAFKIGLSRMQPDHILNGLREQPVIVGSMPAHFSHQSAAIWLGIGRNSYLTARSHTDQTTDLEDLERLCSTQIEHGRKIACIVGVGGTTSNMAIDNFAEIAALRNQLVHKYALDYRPHVHCDSVIGWAYLHFRNYDFSRNPLGFTSVVLDRIRDITDRLASLKHADTFGIDFHKTGYMPYVSSMIIARDKQDLAELGRESEMKTPLFHEEEAYNPGKFSLETSRPAANMVATWMTLQALGEEGYQVLLGNAQEIAQIVRDLIEAHAQETGLAIVNRRPFGSDVFVRCYPPGTDTDDAYRRELQDDRFLALNTEYTRAFHAWISEHRAEGDNAVTLSKTSAAFYTATGAPVVALRIYVLSPYADAASATALVARIEDAKSAFDATRAPFVEHHRKSI